MFRAARECMLVFACSGSLAFPAELRGSETSALSTVTFRSKLMAQPENKTNSAPSLFFASWPVFCFPHLLMCIAQLEL